MASRFNPTLPRATTSPIFLLTRKSPSYVRHLPCEARNTRVQVANGGGDSYLDMWKKAVDRERKSAEFQNMAVSSDEEEQVSGDLLEKKTSEFGKLLEVPVEERDKAQRMQVIDRAAAAIAAARSLLKESLLPKEDDKSAAGMSVDTDGGEMDSDQQQGVQKESSLFPQSGSSDIGTPGPSFWSWTPPVSEDDVSSEPGLSPAVKYSSSPVQSIPFLEKERGLDILPIPFQSSIIQTSTNLPLPPLESHIEVETAEQETPHLEEVNERTVQFSAHAAEAADALSKVSGALSEGVNPDGSRWWIETGIEHRPEGVVCKWTLTRGVSADKAVEYETKYWEAADELGYKELGSEKSGRDADGNVWREYWRESMMQIDGAVHLEKTADKWGKNARGGEWHEKWFEHYGDGKSQKWADKWCSIDPYTPLEDGHAHVWHERWGEEYDGQGGSTKYTDKWAERFEGDGWSKWGDKWDEHFNPYAQGVKQGETWWQGKYGDRWNRTWGEGHNGSGWVHKYGKSCSGEHWDTHIQQDTWYERFPHYGFYHCFENSASLRGVKKPSEWSDSESDS